MDEAAVCITLDAREHGSRTVRRLYDLCRHHRGNQAMYLHAETSAGLVTIELGLTVDAFDPEFFNAIEREFGIEMDMARGRRSRVNDRQNENGRWLPAEPTEETFGVLWGRLWHERHREGEPKWVAFVRSWFDARAIARMTGGSDSG